jgi:iron complex outermembrane receptor protein
MRIAVQNQHLDGYWDNLNFSGDSFGERDSTMIRAQLAYEPSDRLDVLVNVHGGGSYGSPRAVKFLGLTEPGSSNGLGGDPCTLPFDFDDLNTSCEGRDGSPNNSNNDEAWGNVENDVDDIEAAGGSLRLDYDGDSFSLMSLTAYEENDYNHWESNDGFRDLGLFQFRQISSAEQWTQEFRLTSESDGRMRWIAGAFAMWEDAEIESMLFLPVFQEGEIGNTTQKTEMYSPYGQIEYDLKDDLTLTLGARYVYESKEVAGRAYNAVGISTSPENPSQFTFDALRPFDDGSGISRDAGDESWSMWGGKIGLDYRLDSGALLYGHINRGEKAGQYSDSASTIRQGTMSTPVAPETVVAYELGFKSSFADNRLLTNIAVFFNDYTDQQLQITTDGGAVSRFVNAAESETYGVEFEAQYAPTEGWYANMAIGWLQTEITGTDFPADASDTIEVGRSLTNAPEWTANLGLDRVINLGSDGEITIHADVVYNDSRNFNLIDTAETRIFNTDPEFVLVNAHLQYRFGVNKNFRLTAWGKNIFDEMYFNKMESFGPPVGIQQTNLIYMGTPRTYGVTFGVDL